MAFDTFLFLEGIDGESTAVIESPPLPNKAFEIFSWSFGASNPSTVGSGKGGLSAGKVSVSTFNVMKKTENASAQLFLNSCTGQHIEKGTIIMRKATLLSVAGIVSTETNVAITGRARTRKVIRPK